MNYKELQVWQPQVMARFERVLQENKLGHAYLFSGHFASFDMALFLSQAQFCTESSNHLPCGNCRNCRLIANEEFTDVTVVRPQGNVIRTETIRELVKHFTQSGFESAKQIFIVCDADKMHPNAANSLLKVIEEPQIDVTIFLLTNHEEAMLPTIKSRTQIVSFPKNRAVLTEYLEKEGVLKSQARILAELVASQDEALQLMKNKAFQELMVVIPRFVKALLEMPNQAYLMVSQLINLTSDKEEQERLLELLTLSLAEHRMDSLAQSYLAGLIEVRSMWKSNVSLQNALEYMILKKE